MRHPRLHGRELTLAEHGPEPLALLPLLVLACGVPVHGRLGEDTAACVSDCVSAPHGNFVKRSLRYVILWDKLASPDVPVRAGGLRPGRVPARGYLSGGDGRAERLALHGPPDQPPVTIRVLDAEQLAFKPVALLAEPL